MAMARDRRNTRRGVNRAQMARQATQNIMNANRRAPARAANLAGAAAAGRVQARSG